MPRGGKLRIATTNVALSTEEASQRASDAQAGVYIVVSIEDTGEGMSASTIARAVEPFFTTKGIGKGTGLGLSQVYGFVRQSGGFLSIDSVPGEGTRVRLYLPAAAATSTHDAVGAGRSVMPGGDETVLLLEDDDDVRAGGMTGIELVREVVRCNPDVGVLLISGHMAGRELPHRDSAIGEFPLLGKPFRHVELATAVRAAIDRSPGHKPV